MTSTTTLNPSPSKFTDQATEAVDKLGDRADAAISGTRRAANEMVDDAAAALQDARDRAEPAAKRVAAQAEALARRGIDAVRESSKQLRDQAVNLSDQTTRYVKDEPLKSVLIAAATGAALMALLSLVTRSRSDR